MPKTPNKQKKLHDILRLLKDTWHYSVEHQKLMLDASRFLTVTEISIKAKTNKQNFSNIRKKNKSLFCSTTNNKHRVAWGLTEDGMRAWQSIYDTYYLPSIRKGIASEMESYSKKFFEGSWVTINNISDFRKHYSLLLAGVREFPFEMKVKLKDKFRKNKKEFYELLMDKELVEGLLK